MHGLGSVLLLLTAAVVVVVCFRYWKLPPLLGYLTAGILVGPGVLAMSQGSQSLSILAEFGVVFLMFSIGLEFSLPKLFAMRRSVFVVGGGQVGLSVLLTMAIVFALQLWEHFNLPLPHFLQGLNWRSGIVLGAVFAMSSTAIVIKALADSMSLDSPHGRNMVGVLLFQDLAVVLFLVLIPALSQPADALLWALGLAALKTGIVLLLLFVVGQRLMQRLFDLIARQHSSELFTLTVLLITLGLSFLTELAGLSLALGAFVAGMLIAETPYRHAVEDDIKPFRDVLLGLFFLTLGMQLDVDVLLRQPFAVFSLFLVPMVLKGCLIYAVVKHPKLGGALAGTAIRSALGLSAAGEFGFVLLNLAIQKSTGTGIISTELSQVVLAGMLLSMLCAPLLIQLSDRIAMFIQSRDWMSQSLSLHSLATAQIQSQPDVIILGYGRSGQAVAQVLAAQGKSTLALDLDPDRVAQARAVGYKVQYGDAAKRETLNNLHIAHAQAVIITFADAATQFKVLHDLRQLSSTVPIVVRAHDEALIDALKQAGATDVVPEIVEGSLMLASHALLRLGVPMRRVLAAAQTARGDGYQGLSAYFHGADDDAQGVKLHTVVLPPGAWAVGKTVQTIKAKLASTQIEVRAVRDPLGDFLSDTEICDADVAWLLRGDAAQLDAAESALLKK